MEGKIVYIILILLGIYLILGEFTATGKKYLSRFVKSIIPG
jgi:membrane-bound ClpP family serine protease